MVLKQRLDQRQVQKLILAPALQQAIKLLPLTNLELIEIIDNELSQNPVLEDETTETKVRETEGKEGSNEDAGGEPPSPGRGGGRAGRESPMCPGTWSSNPSSRITSTTASGPIFPRRGTLPALENTLSKNPSLWDHLNWQANLTFFDPADKETAQLVIGNIDEDGYLRRPRKS